MVETIKCEDNVWQIYNDEICFAFVQTNKNHKDLLEKISKECNTESLRYNSLSKAKMILHIHKREAQKIRNVIQACINLGHNVFLNDGSQLLIDPSIGVYCWENREHALFTLFLQLKEDLYSKWKDNWHKVIASRFKLAFNYINTDLQEFCLLEFPLANMTEQDKQRCQDKPQSVAHKVESLSSETEEIGIEDSELSETEEIGFESKDNSGTKNGFSTETVPNEWDQIDGFCVVCEETEANTLIDPCNHIIICEQCSDKLCQDERYRTNCILCRQPIETITYIKSGRIVQIN